MGATLPSILLPTMPYVVNPFPSKDAFDKDVVEEFNPNDVEAISEKVREHTFGAGSSSSSSGGGKAGDP